MLALRDENKMIRTDSIVFNRRKFGNGLETDENTVHSTVLRTSRFGTYFRHTSHTEEKNPFSRSLTDLTELERTWARLGLARKADSCYVSANMQFQWTETKIGKEAGRRVTHLLMLNAWRCRRLADERSRTLVSELDTQVESLNMQVYALRQLLQNEKTRRDLAVKEMHTKKVACERERNTILKEKEALEGTLKKLNDESENQKINLKAAKTEAEMWELRYIKEKKISKSLQDHNVVLGQQIQVKEEKIAYQTQCLTALNRRKTELEGELDAHLVLLNKTVEQVNSLQEKHKLSEELREQQGRLLMEKVEEINQLRVQIELMEVKFLEQDERNGELGKLISDKTKELILLQDKLGELIKNQRFWGNRIIKMASICMRIPIACLYTVATLLLPQPSYSSM